MVAQRSEDDKERTQNLSKMFVLSEMLEKTTTPLLTHHFGGNVEKNSVGVGGAVTKLGKSVAGFCSETTAGVFSTSSVWRRTVSNGYTGVAGGTLKT